MLPKNPFVQNKILAQIKGGLTGVKNTVQQNIGKLGSNISNAIPDIGRKPQQPQTQQRQQNLAPIGPRLQDGSFYKDDPKFIGPRLPDGRISQLHSAPAPKQPVPKTTDISFNGSNSGSNSISAYSNVDSSVSKKNQENVSSELSQYEADRQAELQRQVEEEKKRVAEQERKNEEFRQKIGDRFNELRGQYGNILGQFQTKLGEMPNAIRQLGQQYKAAIGEQETQRLGQIGQQRERVAEQQKSGLRAIAEDVRRQTKSATARLSQMGAGNSSAAKMFQFAIQKAANSNTANLLKQAANNYNNLDQEEIKLKSEYNTMRNNLDLDEQNNIKRVDSNINNIIKNINDNLAQSGELERLSKEELNAVYVDELTNAYRNAVQQSKTMKDQLEQWRLENAKSINSLKNQLIQEFIPKDITTEKLTGITPSQEQEPDTSQGLNLRRLRKLQEEGTPQNIANPNTLQARVRRLREQL